jgi:tetratricopeptide (TPR) repeat protein
MFLDAHLKRDKEAVARLKEAVSAKNTGKGNFHVAYRKGHPSPPLQSVLIQRIIQKGMAESRSYIDRMRQAYPGRILFEESVLNWLGYHFLLWWGREEEALEVFKLNVDLFAESSNAYDSLGEAYYLLRQIPEAIRCYEKSLELNPENSNASVRLKQLRKK